MLLFLPLLLQGCAGWTTQNQRDALLQEKMKEDDAIYKAYEERNTLDGYQDFINKYPDNRNAAKAHLAIEELEYTDCDDTACLRDFAARHPESRHISEVQERLKAADMRDLDKVMTADYGFDLLLYRLNLKRLKKELIDGGQERFADFSETFSLADYEGKRYFNTTLTFPDDPSLPKFSTPQMTDELFSSIILHQLDYLMTKFRKKGKIDGFGFEITATDRVTYKRVVLQFHFRIARIEQYLNGGLSKETFLNESLFVPDGGAARP